MTAIDVARLPRQTLEAGTPLYRVHRAHLGPWYFDDSPLGRFNPTGVPGRGTCYWAAAPLARGDRSRVRASTVEITTFISSCAKAAPRQRRTPPPNGTHV